MSTTLFLAISLSSVVLLGVSSFYAVDTYRAFGFTVEITDILVYKNETSGEYTRVKVQIKLFNPSFTLPIEYLWSKTHTMLNDQRLYLGIGDRYSRNVIPPGGFYETHYFQELSEFDQSLFQSAEASDTWIWFEFLQPYVDGGFLGPNQVNRPLLFEGVTLVPI